jgi:hypothetical protein
VAGLFLVTAFHPLVQLFYHTHQLLAALPVGIILRRIE